MVKSTATPRKRKAKDRPKKPYPEFPLTPHAGGKWMKKIRGKIHYFGRWAKVVHGHLERVEGDGWKEAIDDYNANIDGIQRTGRKSEATAADGLTVANLCNQFLNAKLRKRDAGEMGPRMFAEYKEVTDLIVANFGKTRLVEGLVGSDFGTLRAELAKRWGPVRLANTITRIKSVFKFATDNELIARPMKYGTEFHKPDKAVMRKHRAKSGPKMLEADQLRRLLDLLEGKELKDDEGEKFQLEANPSLRAMVLLGLNCGFGNTDVATLPIAAVNLAGGWIDYPRPKTGIGRRCPLWPETIAALKAVLAARPEPTEAAAIDCVFLNSRGTQWVRSTPSFRSDSLSRMFRDAVAAAGLKCNGSFYTLRHVFRTIADTARDPVAIDHIMGHSDPSMGERYRERIDDARLTAVTDAVRTWLFGK